MYKSRLQEYCQSKSWELPVYSTTKEGLDHCPQFKTSVTVNGSTFTSPDFFKSSKEAQNAVAKLAFDQLAGSVTASSSLPDTPTSSDGQQPKMNETLQAASSSGVNSPNRDDKQVKDMAHLYKNQLQIYAQKTNLALPIYISEREGPPHACRFKSKVILDQKTYKCLEYFRTIKDAENAAARVALMSVSSDGVQEEDPGFFKNLLQELAQKEFSCLPEYNTTWSGASHQPIFVSVVEIKEESFRGQEAKTKKLAEMNAAKVAYAALKEREWKRNSEPYSPGCNVNETPHSSSPTMQSFDLDEFPQITLPEPNLASSEVSMAQARCNKGAHQKAAIKSECIMMEPEVNTNFSQNICGPKVQALPISEESPYSGLEAPVRSPSRASVSVVNVKQLAELDASSSPKKVKVYPQMPNMTLPPGVTIKHSDEKWVAVTADSVHGNE